MYACRYCSEVYETRDELVDHLTDEEDAFSAVTDIVVEVQR